MESVHRYIKLQKDYWWFMENLVNGRITLDVRMCLLCIILTGIISLLAYSHYLWIPSFRFIATTRYKLDYSTFGSQWNIYFHFWQSVYFSYMLLLLLYLIAWKCSSFVVDWQEQRMYLVLLTLMSNNNMIYVL